MGSSFIHLIRTDYPISDSSFILVGVELSLYWSLFLIAVA